MILPMVTLYKSIIYYANSIYFNRDEGVIHMNAEISLSHLPNISLTNIQRPKIYNLKCSTWRKHRRRYFMTIGYQQYSSILLERSRLNWIINWYLTCCLLLEVNCYLQLFTTFPSSKVIFLFLYFPVI